MSRSELGNDDHQQSLPQQPTITPASVDKDQSPVADMPFSPAPPFEDQKQPLPQQPTIIATTINNGESHVATMMTVVPSSSAPPLSSVSADISKKRRGRPLGSRNQIQSKKRAYGPVIPAKAHIMMVNVEENVLEKIMTFSKNLSGNISVLSAVGTASKATICIAGKTETYEGKFEIISLGGSLFPDQKESHCKVLEGLNVSLSSDGNIFGGKVVDILIAASPVQIVLGSYPAGSREEVKSDPEEPPKEDSSQPSDESQVKVESGPKVPPKEDSSQPSAKSQEKVESDPKEHSEEDPNPPLESTLNNSSSDGLNVLV
ncbi:AT-hook motif nuclear-localized protein 10-like [Medicago truncatula]|uniref:AT-hook motif nuclear-localized protein 10-like n=1 Tax=Medicago truncatula TaxID=3880 RepID=UPI001966FB00|nr:AT-hook motif nuclear-localized protein 10-like [Medicago truncatula]